MGKSSINWPFSMAMLNNQRVEQHQWEFQDPKMEVRKRTIFSDHILWGYSLTLRPYIW